MFFEYKKYIYPILIVVGVFLAFVIGRATIKVDGAESTNVVEETKQHDNINQVLKVDGRGVHLEYEIKDLNIVDDILSFTFKINDVESENVTAAKVIVKDEKNQILSENPVDSRTLEDKGESKNLENKIRYEVDLTKKEIKEAHIVVYAISGDINSMESVNLEEAPFNKSVINIELLKQEMINKLSN